MSPPELVPRDLTVLHLNNLCLDSSGFLFHSPVLASAEVGQSMLRGWMNHQEMVRSQDGTHFKFISQNDELMLQNELFDCKKTGADTAENGPQFVNDDVEHFLPGVRA